MITVSESFNLLIIIKCFFINYDKNERLITLRGHSTNTTNTFAYCRLLHLIPVWPRITVSDIDLRNEKNFKKVSFNVLSCFLKALKLEFKEKQKSSCETLSTQSVTYFNSNLFLHFLIVW